MDVIFFGPPGSGKGTQAKFLLKEFDFLHISTGDLLRSAVASKSELGLKVKEIIESGKLVSDEIVNAIVVDALKASQQSVVYDGYPRSVEQAVSLDSALKAMRRSISHVFSFEIDYQVLASRVVGRRVCTGCGAIYHIEHKKPKVEGVCDLCGKGLKQRADDTAEVIKKRIDEYNSTTLMVREYYSKLHKIAKVDATLPQDQISEFLRGQLGSKN